jgi:nitroreductase
MKKICIGFVMCLLMLGLAYGKEDANMKDTFSIIHSRKSVRSFTGAPVSKNDLDKIIKAGMAAPTAVNMQPWSFIAITDRKKLDALAEGLPNAKMLFKAGAAIIICTEPDKAFNKSKILLL